MNSGSHHGRSFQRPRKEALMPQGTSIHATQVLLDGLG
jgi:hypothetical protein